MKPPRFTLPQLLDLVAKDKPLPQDWAVLLPVLNEALTRKLITHQRIKEFCTKKSFCLLEKNHPGSCFCGTRGWTRGSGYVLTAPGRKARESSIRAWCKKTGRDPEKVLASR